LAADRCESCPESALASLPRSMPNLHQWYGSWLAASFHSPARGATSSSASSPRVLLSNRAPAHQTICLRSPPRLPQCPPPTRLRLTSLRLCAASPRCCAAAAGLHSPTHSPPESFLAPAAKCPSLIQVDTYSQVSTS